jgi:hypothetical protein
MSGKYGALINKVKEEANAEKARMPENQISGLPEKEEAVNLSIKVPAASRRHWASEAKRTGTTLTTVIVEALNEKFGTPNS